MKNKWTTERPKKDGFYWFRGKIKGYHGAWENVEPVIVSVRTLTDEMEAYFPEGSSNGVEFDDLDGEWIGPLEAPINSE